MHLTPADARRITGSYSVVRAPERPDVAAQSDPKVIETVSAMLSEIERDGLAAVRRYAERLDGWTGGEDFEVAEASIGRADRRPARRTCATPSTRVPSAPGGSPRCSAPTWSTSRTRSSPASSAASATSPVGNVGAYLPAGRFPLLASAFMTVGVARAAGVPNVVSCTPPSQRTARSTRPSSTPPAPPAPTASSRSAACRRSPRWPSACSTGSPSDMIVGAGNAFVAEAKRQLYGKVGIDVLAGPSEVAVIADETATAQMVAADLLAQAEHGPDHARLPRDHVGRARRGRRDRGRRASSRASRPATSPGRPGATGARSTSPTRPKTAVEIMNVLAPEHLEILAEDTDFYLENMTNYGSLFLGEWSTVAYADKGMSGTNHVLPTARGARYTGGLSVTGYLKQLTYQKATRASTEAQAGPVVTIADFEGMPGHRDSAQLRLDLHRRAELRPTRPTRDRAGQLNTYGHRSCSTRCVRRPRLPRRRSHASHASPRSHVPSD